MESIEKAREAIRKDAFTNANLSKAFNMGGSSEYADTLEGVFNAIEAEIAERYMELPLDADGVPIHVGDEMESDNERFVIRAVAPGLVHRWDIHDIGELDKGTVAYPPETLYHVKPRTLEDVLQCAGVSIAAIEDVAAEIRDLLGVEE